MKRLWCIAILLILPCWAEASVLESGGFQLNLYMSFEFEYQIDEEGLGDPNGSFDSDQIDLAFNYSVDKMRIGVDLVLEHGVATEEDWGNVELSWGFFEYAFADAAKVKVGKVLTPIGIQNEMNTVRTGFLTVKNPLSVYKAGKLVEGGYRFAPRRQVGIGMVGGANLGSGYLQYDAYMANGFQSDTNPYEEDNNSQKSVTGRVTYEFTPGVTLGGSLYTDTIDEEGDRANMTSYGLHFDYDGGRLLVRTEVFSGDLDPNGGPTREQLGAYLDVGYRFGKVTPYGEIQYVSIEEGDHSESAQAVVLGVFWQINRHFVIKVENAYFKGSEDNLVFEGIPGNDYNELHLALIAGF